MSRRRSGGSSYSGVTERRGSIWIAGSRAWSARAQVARNRAISRANPKLVINLHYLGNYGTIRGRHRWPPDR